MEGCLHKVFLYLFEHTCWLFFLSEVWNAKEVRKFEKLMEISVYNKNFQFIAKSVSGSCFQKNHWVITYPLFKLNRPIAQVIEFYYKVS